MAKASTTSSKSKLNPKQELFVLEYLKDFNAKQAAIRSGYNPACAKTRGSHLLDRPDVQERIFLKFKEVTTQTSIDVETVLQALQEFALVNPVDAYNDDGSLRLLSDMPKALQRSIASIEVDEIWEMQTDEDNPRRRHKVQIGETKKVRFWDKPKGLELLGKYLAMFVERQRHEDPNGEPLPAVQVHVHQHTAPKEETGIRPEVAATVQTDAVHS